MNVDRVSSRVHPTSIKYLPYRVPFREIRTDTALFCKASVNKLRTNVPGWPVIHCTNEIKGDSMARDKRGGNTRLVLRWIDRLILNRRRRRVKSYRLKGIKIFQKKKIENLYFVRSFRTDLSGGKGIKYLKKNLIAIFKYTIIVDTHVK